MANVDNPGVNHYDPFLSADGRHLYYAPTVPPNGQQIVMATRGDITANFSSGQVVTSIKATSSGVKDADPAVSLDEKIIVFSSDRSGTTGGTDLWYATRTDATQDFGAPRLIPNVNSDDNDGDPFLSADGCTLYFASERKTGDNFDLYTATVVH